MGPDPSQAPLSRSQEAEKLFCRFQEFPVLADPLAGSFARQLIADGYHLERIPLMPDRSVTAFLAARLFWRNLEIHLRQPDDGSLLICNIARGTSEPALGSPLLALASFLRYAVHRSDLIEVIGGCVSKSHNAGEGNLPYARLRDFYIRLVGDLHEHRDFDVVWLFGLTRRPARYNKQKIWSRRET